VAITSRGRSVMALYTSSSSLDCHRVRFVLAVKGINVEIINVDSDPSSANDLADLNPYNETPTLVDRDLILYGAGVITEYLDERYPHPPLMPVDPVSRAGLRLVRYRIMRDWYSLARRIETAVGRRADKPRKQLKESLSAANDLFTVNTFLMNEELSLVDCSLAPLLWRLPTYKITLTKQAQDILDYMERVFSKEAFRTSLSDVEREMGGGA